MIIAETHILAELLDKQKKHVNESIRKMFSDKIDGQIIRPSLDSRGYVVDYHLPELESKMFVAKHDINYLQKITEFWISKGKAHGHVKRDIEKMLNDLELSPSKFGHIYFDSRNQMIYQRAKKSHAMEMKLFI